MFYIMKAFNSNFWLEILVLIVKHDVCKALEADKFCESHFAYFFTVIQNKSCI